MSHRFNLCIYFSAIFVFLKISFSIQEEVFDCSKCQFNHHHKSTGKDSIERLKPLCGKRFNINEKDRSIFSYYLGICTSATVAEFREDFKDIGLIQKDSSTSGTFRLGSIKQADLKTGTNWLLLEYSGGDTYANSCNKAHRTVSIMIICDPNESEGKLEYIEEDNTEEHNCYYLFQLSHKAVCNGGGGGGGGGVAIGGLSVGSIVCLIVITTTACYFILGFLFMRFVRGNRGFAQIPNFNFWRELGHLQADGCNFICRCSDRHINNYSGDIRRGGNEASLVYEEGYNN